MGKRGISPLIATVLLIGFAIVLAALIMRWSTGVFEESTTGTTEATDQAIVVAGLDIELKDVRSTNGYNSITILVENKANFAMTGFIVRLTGSEGMRTVEIEEELKAHSSEWIEVFWEGYIGKIGEVEVIPQFIMNNNVITGESASQTERYGENEYIEPDQHTVAYWKFDEGSGTDIEDSSGNGFEGVANNAAWVGGHEGNALEFNGIDSYVNFVDPDITSLQGDQLTVEAWINPVNVNTGNIIIKNGPFSIRLGSGNLIVGVYTGGGWVNVYSSNTIASNEWRHISLVYDGQDVMVYLDGQLDNSLPQAGNLAGNGCVQVGRRNSGSICDDGVLNYYNGVIDEIRISNVARDFEGSDSEEEIGECTDGEVRLCSNQNGVCFSSSETCTGEAWPGCDYFGISGYENPEISCDDGDDNDCDTLEDCDDNDCDEDPVCSGPVVGDYYVDPNSAHGGTCSDSYVSPYGESWDTPWCSIEFAVADASSLSAGDTLVVAEGIHTLSAALIPKSGSAGNSITIKAENQNTILDANSQIVNFGGRNNLVFEGFTINNCNTYLIRLASSQNIIIKDLYFPDGECSGILNGDATDIYDIVIDGITAINSGGITLCDHSGTNPRTCDNITIKNCYIDMGAVASAAIGTYSGSNILVHNNTVLNVAEHAYSFDGGDLPTNRIENITLTNNICYKCHDVAIWRADGVTLDHNTIILNDNSYCHTDSSYKVWESTNVKQTNSLFAQAPTIRYQSPLSDLTQDYNYYFNMYDEISDCSTPEQFLRCEGTGCPGSYLILSDWQSATGLDTNSAQARGNIDISALDSLFVNPASFDFRPQAGTWPCGAASDGSDVGALPCA